MNAARPHWWPAYVGIGSNLASPIEQVQQAIQELGNIPNTRLVRASGLYRSAPMGPPDQPDFVNAVAALLTQQDAGNLLKLMLKIEDAHGRERAGERWGPRTLDLDLLLYGNQQVRSAELDLPHPGIAERNFVLLPLDELAPHLEVPGLASVHRLKAALSADDVQIEKLTKQ